MVATKKQHNNITSIYIYISNNLRKRNNNPLRGRGKKKLFLVLGTFMYDYAFSTVRQISNKSTKVKATFIKV